MTCSLRSTSAVGPDAISLPKSSTAVRLAAGRHEAHVVVDEYRRARRSRPGCAGSPGRGARSPRPAARRPARRAARAAAVPTTARATSTRRRCAGAERADRLVRVVARDRRTRRRPSRPGAGSRAPPPVCSCTSSTLSNTDEVGDRLLGLERAPQSPAGPAEVGIASRSLAERDRPRPAIGRTKPLRTLKNVVLPAPLGPISPHVPRRTSRSCGRSGRRRRTARSGRRPRSRRRLRGRLAHGQSRRSCRPSLAEVLRHLLDDPAGRGEQHLQDADAEQDREPLGGHAPVVEQRGQQPQEQRGDDGAPDVVARRPSARRRAAAPSSAPGTG